MDPCPLLDGDSHKSYAPSLWTPQHRRRSVLVSDRVNTLGVSVVRKRGTVAAAT